MGYLEQNGKKNHKAMSDLNLLIIANLVHILKATREEAANSKI